MKKSILTTILTLLALVAYSQESLQIDSIRGVLSAQKLSFPQKSTAYLDLAFAYEDLSVDSFWLYIDKAVATAEASKEKSIIRDIYLEKGSQLIAYNQYTEGIAIIKKAINLAGKQRYNEVLARGYFELAKAQNALGEYDSAIQMFQNSIHHQSDSIRIVSALINVGALYMAQGKTQKASDHYLKAIQLIEQMPQKPYRQLAHLYMMLGTLKDRSSTQAESYAYYQKAQPLAIQSGNMRLQAALAVNMVRYFEDNNLDSMLVYARKGLEFSEKGGTAELLPYLLESTVTAFVKTGQLDSARFYLNQFSPVNDYEALNHQHSYYYAHALFYEAINQLPKSLSYLDSGVSILDEDGDLGHLSSLYYAKYQVLKKMRRFEEALQWSDQYHTLNDTLYQEEYKEYLAELEEKYESEKKEASIAKLEQEKAIQTLQLRQSVWGLVGLGIALILAVTGGFFYYQSYKSKRETAEAELKQRFLRSQLNPHFIFNAIGAIQEYIFKFGAEKGNEYLSVFSKLMRQILEFSREKFISIDDEVETLTNYLQMQQMLHQDKFTYQIEVDENLATDMEGIPPMFAQPIIENALEHGLFHKSAENHIHIAFQKLNDQQIKLTISDNGTGFQNAQSEVNHQSLSTVITRERLEILEKQTQQKTAYQAQNMLDALGKVMGAKVELDLPLVAV